jgi:hypothetical protein
MSEQPEKPLNEDQVLDLLNKHSDMAQLFTESGRKLAAELRSLGLTNEQAKQCADVAQTELQERIQIQGEIGSDAWLTASMECQAITWAIAWVLISGNPTVKLRRDYARYVEPIEVGHPMAAMLQEDVENAMLRRFGIEPTRLADLMADELGEELVAVAMKLANKLLGDPECDCPNCLVDLIRSSKARRIHAAGIMLAWCLIHETLFLIGRNLSARRIANPAQEPGLEWECLNCHTVTKLAMTATIVPPSLPCVSCGFTGVLNWRRVPSTVAEFHEDAEKKGSPNA